MIKITRIRIMRIFPGEPLFLHIDFEVDGTPWCVTDLDITWDYTQVMGYLNTQEADIQRQIALQSPSDEYPKTLYLDTDTPQRNPLVEIDNLKARIKSLEARRL